MDIIAIFFTAFIINNFVLTQFLGLCPFIGISNNLGYAVGMAMATSLIMVITAACSFIIFDYLLLPFSAEYLQPFFTIIVIAILVQALEMLMKISSPMLFRALGIYLPLITSNCAVLGVALIVTRQQTSLLDATMQGFGAGAGFSCVLIVFAAMREKLLICNIPNLLKGAPIVIFSIAISSLAFLGFSGI